MQNRNYSAYRNFDSIYDKVKENPYPLFAGIALLIALTIWAGVNYRSVLGNIREYLFSFGSIVPFEASGILKIGIIVGAVVVIDLILMLLLAWIAVSLIAGKTKHEHALDKVVKKIGHSVASHFFLVFWEELFARLFFMGVLGKFLPGGMFVWGLIGNVIWALMHFSNYHQEDRQIIRVLPQFVGGLFLMFVFANFGFFWAIIAHFSFNAMLFSVYKRKDGIKTEIIYAAYWGIVALVAGYFFLSIDGSGILKKWLVGDFTRASGARFTDYLVVFIAISALSEFILTVAGYDIKGIKKKDNFGLFDVLLGGAIFIGFIFLGVLIGNWVGAPHIAIVVGITILLIILSEADTVSAMSRLWFDGLITNFILVSVIITFGFWSSLFFIFLFYLLDITPRIIRRKVGKFSYEDE